MWWIGDLLFENLDWTLVQLIRPELEALRQASRRSGPRGQDNNNNTSFGRIGAADC